MSRLKWLFLIPVGLVIIAFQIWLYINVPAWQDKITIYILLTALLFSIGAWRIERGLLTGSFIKEIPKFLLFAGITFGILFLSALLVSGKALPNIAVALTGIPIYLIFAQAFVVSTDETYIFQGILPEALSRRKISKRMVWFLCAFTFALFHIGMSGWNWFLILPYIPLGYLFLYMRKYSPETLTAIMGVHFAWNIFILGFGSALR